MDLHTTTLERVDPDDATAVAEATALHNAANAVDTPHDPPDTPALHAAGLRHGWDGEPPTEWLLRDGDRTIGTVSVSLPRRDNRHMAFVGVVVHPDLRRRGHGRRLFAHAESVAREADRTLLVTSTVDTEGATAFAAAMGLERASVEAQRRQDLATLDRVRVRELRDEAARHAAAYELLRLGLRTPDDMLDAVAEMSHAMNDAPRDDLQMEDEVVDAARLRAFEAAQEGHDRRIYRLVARRREDGELGGYTVVGIDRERPEWGWQLDTGVVRAHRGHRLGMLLKASMLEWLAEAEPQLRWIDTWNAASNSYMIAVNEALGYQLQRLDIGWQRRL